MAQKRMLDKKISVSEQVANLSTEAQLLFTWSIPHADDIGLLPYSHRTLKALVVPMKDWSIDEFSGYVGEIVGENLWVVFQHGKDEFYRLPEFFATQTLKKDRKPATLLPFVKTWEDAEELGFQMETIGFQMEDNGNPREGKLREEKRREDTGDKSPPQSWEEKIRVKDPEYRDLVKDLASRDYLSPKRIHAIIEDEFLPHWLERSPGATKSLWQKERAFDYQKRIRTWIKNFHSFAKDYKCTEDKWHRKGETCYCKPPEEVVYRKPIKEMLTPEDQERLRSIGKIPGNEVRQTRE